MKFTAIFVILSTLFFTSHSDIEDAFYDYYVGIEAASESEKPILLFFTARSCENPKLLNTLIQEDEEIRSRLEEKYVSIILYVDDRTKLESKKNVERDGQEITLKSKGDEWAHIEITKYKNNIQPLMVIINSEEEILKEPLIGKVSKDKILDYLEF